MTDSRKLFGTDGVRGVANIEPVTAETALKLGRAAAHVFSSNGGPYGQRVGTRPKIVLGKDTRLSGYCSRMPWSRALPHSASMCCLSARCRRRV